MMMYNPCKIIAEIGCNHKGDMEIAKELIKVAKIFCNVDAVKFQKRNNKELLTEEQYQAPHPNPVNSYGATYGAHREFLEFSKAQHAELKAYCEKVEIEFLSTPFDLESAKFLNDMMEAFKISSSDITNKPFIEFMQIF